MFCKRVGGFTSLRGQGRILAHVKELIDKVKRGEISYGVTISLKRDLVAHINVPLDLWLKHRRKKSKPFGNNVASIDIRHHFIG